jgi:hypothetical protein
MGVGLSVAPSAAVGRAVLSTLGTLWIIFGIWFQRQIMERNRGKGSRMEASSVVSGYDVFHPDALCFVLSTLIL